MKQAITKIKNENNINARFGFKFKKGAPTLQGQ